MGAAAPFPGVKAIFLTQNISRRAGGLCDAVRRFAQELEAGGDVTIRVIAPAVDENEIDWAAWAPLEPELFRFHGPRSYVYSSEVAPALAEARPNLVHTHGLWTHFSVVGASWRRRTGQQYVISPHGMLDPWALQNSGWKKRIAMVLYEQRHLESASCLHAVSPAEAESFRALGLKNPICIIPNGVDLPERGNAGSRLRDATWDRLTGGRKVLLFLSRLHPKKGLPNLLRAWGEIQKLKAETGNAEEWLLVIAGWDQGGHEAELKELCGKLRVANCDLRNGENEDAARAASVAFTGPLFGTDRDMALAHADAFVLPSHSEGLPLAVLEAWANRLPAIITPGCNLPEGAAAGAAIECNPTPDGLATALRRLFEMSEAERQEMGGRGRTLVEARFTWQRIAAEMGEVYSWLLGGGSLPACVRL